MKKLLLIVLLFISVVANAQKGISYQAVILDPAKIEIPGQDISGQPFVNGNVNVKFVILSGTTSQFEEVQQTKTDAYGLVNLTIGSVASTAFNALTWDANQKSMQVFVSFNNGASYTKVSDQKLTYSPYALFTETAGKLGSTLEIAGGGTGATTAVGVRANMGLGNVDNTSDAAKPVSTATLTALNLKANASDLNAGLDLKAPLASPTFTGTVSGITKNMVGLGSVDNTTDAAKPISTATQTALNLKAPIASPTFTGTITSGSDFSGNGRIKILSNNNEYSDAVGNQLYIDSYVKTYTGPAGNIPVYSTAYINANTLFSSQNAITISNATALHLLPPTNYNIIASKLWALYAEGNIKSLGFIEATGYKIPNGTSSQYLMADGSVSTASATDLTTGTTGILPIASGGTGSSTKNFVDLTSAQTIEGSKIFSSDLTVNGLIIGRGNGNISSNTTTGKEALSSNTTGIFNTAYGESALKSNTTGTNNTASGAQALFNNTIGTANTANGTGALFSNTTGLYNTASGNSTLYFNNTGSANTASGASALIKNTIGSQNTASGASTLFNNTIGSQNTASGRDALYSNTEGSNNTASGYRVLYTNTTGANNTAVGRNALSSNTTGSNNTALGYGADVASNNLTNAAAIGNGALVSTSNAIQLGNTSVTDVKTSGTITAGDITYPKAHGTSGQVLGTTGSGTLTWTTPTSVSVGTISSTSNAKGATITAGGVLSLTPADATNGGVVTNGAQTFAGVKTFNDGISYLKLNDAALDQSNPTAANSIGGNNVWQSFTAGVSGKLSSVEFKMISPLQNFSAGTYTVKIYDGEGITGTLLGTTTGIVSGSSWTFFPFDFTNAKISVVSGQLYTIYISTPTLYWANLYVNINDSYASGRASPFSNWDLVFKTYVSPTTVDSYLPLSGGSLTGNLVGANTATSTISGFAANMNTQTGTSYTLLASDNGKIITLNNASAITLTVPALFTGFNCMIVQLGAGEVTLTPSGTTISNRSSYTKTAGTNAIVSLIGLSGTTFISAGDMR